LRKSADSLDEQLAPLSEHTEALRAY